MTLLEHIDPRLQPALFAEWARRRGELVEPLPRDVSVVLAGHRAAGKTRLLPHVATAMGREGVDLDAELERRFQRPLREWVSSDEPSFRAAERETFRSLAPGLVVAVGGGFLSQHSEVLRGCVVVEVPLSFPTYVARLSADTTRPRLRPDLSLEEELRETFTERETRHAAARPMKFVDFLLRLDRPRRARRVVTLAPNVPIDRFTWAARHAGAELLEVRSDLHPPEIDLLAASRALPLLVARRTPHVPPAWRARASLFDEPLGGQGGPGGLLSLHADAPLTPDAAVAAWARLSSTGSDRAEVRIKHVEPLGAPAEFPRLLETQARLIERFGAERVTVLCTGPLALPFRAVLAQKNALDYLALDRSWSAAPGQRLLADAVREQRRAHVDGVTHRLGILGHGIAFSRSPRLHQQPFDRIDLPEDAPLEALLAALRPHYRGFAVTNPFKRRIASVVGSRVPAINTLVRTATGWHAENSDVAGANAVLDALAHTPLPSKRGEGWGEGPSHLPVLTVLGDGGVTAALRLAASQRGLELRVLTRATIPAEPLHGPIVWTWPSSVDVPPQLQFRDADVAIVAYGAPAHLLAKEIRARGGTPRRWGPRWFIAQARQQRALWEASP